MKGVSILTANSLLQVRDLKKHFPLSNGLFSRKEFVKAVDNVSFSIEKGETFSLVGESGCGKSTTGRLINGLLDADDGKIIYKNNDLAGAKEKVWHSYRKSMQMIFQDPYASLSPKMKIKDAVAEPLIIHEPHLSNEKRLERVRETLEVCGISSHHLNKYPHEFSGGQRQRIGIARALIVQPELIIADEPVSALDVSVQAQVLNLLQDLQEDFGLTYLFISHDLSVVEHVSNRIAVMYLGNIVEITSRDRIFSDPKHPYTKALISSMPSMDPNHKRERIILQGEIPNAVNPPKGCKFHTRCPFAMDICKAVKPSPQKLDNETEVSCHLY